MTFTLITHVCMNWYFYEILWVGWKGPRGLSLQQPWSTTPSFFDIHTHLYRGVDRISILLLCPHRNVLDTPLSWNFFRKEKMLKLNFFQYIMQNVEEEFFWDFVHSKENAQDIVHSEKLSLGKNVFGILFVGEQIFQENVRLRVISFSGDCFRENFNKSTATQRETVDFRCR